MKDRRSKLLRAFVADIERAERPTKADEAFFKRLSEGYPTKSAIRCFAGFGPTMTRLISCGIGEAATLPGLAGRALPS